MKKLVKKVATKKPVSKKVVKKTTKPKSTKRVRKYANGGIGGDDEYNRNIGAVMNAEKELDYIMSQGKNWSNQDQYRNVRYGANANDYSNLTPNARLEKYGIVPDPYATDKVMSDYRNKIDAFYKANPNIKPYVGKLPIKKASLETRPMGELKGMAKGGTKKYAKGGTKAKLGSGERFKALSTKIEKAYQKKGKSKSVAEKIGKATAAIIGMKKYGKAKMTKMAVKGRKGK
jgi:hypothetical protein